MTTFPATHDRTRSVAGYLVGCRSGIDSGVSRLERSGAAVGIGLVAEPSCRCEAGDAPTHRGGSRGRAVNLERVSADFSAAVEAAELALAKLNANRNSERLILRAVRSVRRCDRLREELAHLMKTGNL